MLTYDILNSLISAAYRRQHAVPENAPDPQALLNRRTQLRAFITAAGKSLDSAVDDDFGGRFDDIALRAEARAKAPRTKADLRRGLAWWRRQHAAIGDSAIQTKAAPKPAELGSLSAILGAHIEAANWSNKRAGRVAGVPYMTLVSWLRGATPRAEQVHALRRLEAGLGIPPGSLAKFAKPPVGAGGAPASSYRRHTAALRRDTYRLRLKEVEPMLRGEWTDFMRYKTSPSPGLARPHHAVWATVAKDNAPAGSWHNTIGGRYCSSADIEWRHVTGFFGFALKRAAERGFDEAQDLTAPSLAWFAVPRLVEAYFDFLFERSRDTANNRFKTLANFLRSLVQPRYGWLRQQPALLERIPLGWRPVEWDAACDDVSSLAQHWRNRADAVSRDPFEPIRPLLALPEPFQPVLDAIDTLDARALAVGVSTFTGAAAKRDAALLTLLLCVPLRTRNLALLTLHDGHVGVLRREADGRWWVRIPASATKNRRSIEAPLPHAVTARFDEYAAVHQPRLAHAKDGQRVFPNRDTAGPWFGVSSRVQQLTEMYLKGCPHFHAHAFRHLVATRYLDRHPEDYLTVAHLLGDSLQTVIAKYSRPDAARAIDRAGRDIDALLSGKR